MHLLAIAIGAALAGPPAQDSSLQSQHPTSTPAPPRQTKPGPEVMKPLPVIPDLCLTGRCASV